MKRILFSQNESAIKDDHFVIDGVVELNNGSLISQKAFQQVNDVQNWKIDYKNSNLEIRKKGRFLSIKSHYKNKDEEDRYIYYIYNMETSNYKTLINYLKEDSIKINKEVAFETEKLIQEIKRSKSLTGLFLGIIATILISYVLWKTIE